MWRHNTKKKNVAHFMRSCSICAASKSLNHLRMGTESLSAIALQPFKSWAMDLIGSLQKNVLVSKVHCWSALGPGASGPPYYCTPPVTVPAVLEGLAVWLHNKKKKRAVAVPTIVFEVQSTQDTIHVLLFFEVGKNGNTWIVSWVDCTSKTIVGTATADKDISSEAIAFLTFRKICCCFELPLNLTMDNDVKFVSSLWKSL